MSRATFAATTPSTIASVKGTHVFQFIKSPVTQTRSTRCEFRPDGLCGLGG
jgi:hypothetical protein